MRWLCMGLAAVQAALGGRPPLAAQSPERVEYQIEAALAADRPVVSGRITFRIPRSALASPTEVRLGLRLESGRLIDVSAVGDSAGRTGVMWLSADSATLVAPIAPGNGPAVLMADFATPLDTAARRQLGYYLASSIDDGAAWYPAVLDLPDSLKRFRNFEVGIEVPRGTGLLATGRLTDSVLSRTGTLYRYRAADVEGVALAMGAGYRVETVTNGATLVRAFAPARDLATFRRVAAAAAEAAEWYRETYGFFPVDEIGVVSGGPEARGGLPLPQVVMIHRGDLSEPFVRWITARELARSYWGRWVLDADERLGWLMSALGTWTDQLYLARTGGRSVAEQWRRVDGDNSFERLATAGPARDDGKGATAVYLVAQQLGPDRFVALQRDLLAGYRHRGLGVADFARAAEAAGYPGASALLEAWTGSGARIDYAALPSRRDAAAPGRYWIRIERVGTIAYPVEALAVAPGGFTARVRITGTARVDSVSVALPAVPREVRLDPDGEVPMRSSDHPDMRRVFLMARGAVGPAAEFIRLARAHLARWPDPHLAARVIERLFELGRFEEVFRTAQRLPAAVTCLDRARCYAALQVARSLARTGKMAGARAWLRNLEPAMANIGVAGGSRLEDARRESRATIGSAARRRVRPGSVRAIRRRPARR